MSDQSPVDVPFSQPVPAALPAMRPYGGHLPPPAYWGPPPRPVAPGLGTASVVLAATVALVVVVQFLVSFPAVATLDAIVAGEQVPTGVLDAYDALSSVALLVELAAGVVTVVWLWKSRTFAEAASPGWPHTRSRVWVWLGWFVPVVALWFPYQVVRDVRAATLREKRPGLGGWWAAWLVLGFATNASARLLGSDDPDVWRALSVFDGLAALAVVVAAALWAKVVREVSAGQRAADAPAQGQAQAERF
ncbi:DUF4328 domain-containing protein [Oerskovia sp. Sa1BUA8]|uniref:DUF4328 domain-containing protein n=1 Tax=Oerskovia douganii TaxID=2762210 RepID=A0A9D5YXG5_9CELL|nr:DUF4328 domain-containing protein [Oerskovia douganii]MBE7698887.1 DUF4328 domain-containing protein [Oerskovia douganii]